MYPKIIFNVIAAALLFVIQVAFINALPMRLDGLNLAIVVIIFILVLYGYRLAFWWSFGLGIAIGLFSFLPFGIELAGLLAAVSAASFLLNNFLTNRSLYTFLFLNFIALFVFQAVVYSILFILRAATERPLYFTASQVFWVDQLYALGYNMLATIVGFYLVNYLSVRLKPMFIIKSRNK